MGLSWGGSVTLHTGILGTAVLALLLGRLVGDQAHLKYSLAQSVVEGK